MSRAPRIGISASSDQRLHEPRQRVALLSGPGGRPRLPVFAEDGRLVAERRITLRHVFHLRDALTLGETLFEDGQRLGLDLLRYILPRTGIYEIEFARFAVLTVAEHVENNPEPQRVLERKQWHFTADRPPVASTQTAQQVLLPLAGFTS